MSTAPNYGWRKQSKCIFDSDRRFEFAKLKISEFEISRFDCNIHTYFDMFSLLQTVPMARRDACLFPTGRTRERTISPWTEVSLLHVGDEIVLLDAQVPVCQRAGC